jgi:hypothetical protein
MEMVAALVRIQQNARLTDTAFAASLSVPRSTWQHYKAGKPISLTFVQRAVASYPQIRPQVERLIFGADANNRSSKPRKTQRIAS